MATPRTIEPGYFGSVGMSDPMSSFSERTLRVAWDFGKKSVPEDKTIPLLQLPKGFLIDRISVVQTKPVAAAQNITFGLGSDNTAVVGGTFGLTVGDASHPLLRSAQAPSSVVTSATVTSGSAGETVTVPIPGSLFIDAEDILCMIVPDGVTGDALKEGAFDLCIHGFEVFAEGVAANPLNIEHYRLPLQSAANEAANMSGGQFPQDIND